MTDTVLSAAGAAQSADASPADGSKAGNAAPSEPSADLAAAFSGEYNAENDPVEAQAFMAARREIETQDIAGERSSLGKLRELAGAEYGPAVKVTLKFYSELPHDQRERIDAAYIKGGPAKLPEILGAIARKAIGPIPSDPENRAAEIRELETLMRTNRAAYNKDERAQLRLRLLYRRRDGG